MILEKSFTIQISFSFSFLGISFVLEIEMPTSNNIKIFNGVNTINEM